MKDDLIYISVIFTGIVLRKNRLEFQPDFISSEIEL